eukprot:1837409-Amphidinium_carterae.1
MLSFPSPTAHTPQLSHVLLAFFPCKMRPKPTVPVQQRAIRVHARTSWVVHLQLLTRGYVRLIFEDTSSDALLGPTSIYL